MQPVIAMGLPRRVYPEQRGDSSLRSEWQKIKGPQLQKRSGPECQEGSISSLMFSRLPVERCHKGLLPCTDASAVAQLDESRRSSPR